MWLDRWRFDAKSSRAMYAVVNPFRTNERLVGHGLAEACGLSADNDVPAVIAALRLYYQARPIDRFAVCPPTTWLYCFEIARVRRKHSDVIETSAGVTKDRSGKRKRISRVENPLDGNGITRCRRVWARGCSRWSVVATGSPLLRPSSSANRARIK